MKPIHNKLLMIFYESILIFFGSFVNDFYVLDVKELLNIKLLKHLVEKCDYTLYVSFILHKYHSKSSVNKDII